MTHITHLRSLGAALLFVGLSATSYAQVVVFGPDTAPSTANWSLGASRTVSTSGYSATLSNITTGNPGDALNLDLSFTALSGVGFVAQFVKRDDWSYNPSVSGELLSFDFDGDFRTSGNVAISVGALQGGNTFWTHFNVNQVVSPSSYVDVQFDDVTVADFVTLDGSSATLDFSDTGSEIVWGYFVRRGDAGAGSRNFDIDVDNISFTLATVPEPTSSALILGGFTLLFMKRRRTNR